MLGRLLFCPQVTLSEVKGLGWGRSLLRLLWMAGAARAYMEYFSRSRRAMISFCISLVPSPMIISGASR